MTVQYTQPINNKHYEFNKAILLPGSLAPFLAPALGSEPEMRPFEVAA